MSYAKYQVSGVRCQVSGVTCQVSGVTCHVKKEGDKNIYLYITIKTNKAVELLRGGFVINMATIVSLYKFKGYF